MSLPALALVPLLAAAPPAPEVLAVRLTTLDQRPALRVLTTEGVPSGRVGREGGLVVIRLAARAAAGLAPPSPLPPPLEEVRLDAEGEETVLRVKVPPEAPFEVAHEPGLTTVIFGESPPAELRPPLSPELHARLFPAGSGEAEAPPMQKREDGGGEVSFGRLALRPYASVSWVDADLQPGDAPEPVRARYLQASPGLTLQAPLGASVFAAEYEPRFRFFSDLPGVSAPSHTAGARLELPLGNRVQLRLGHRFSRATLETTTVDPGREYFFDLARYSFHHASAAARVELGPRLFLDTDAGWRFTRFDEGGAGFFDNESRAVRAGLGYDLGDDLRAVVSYSLDRVPPSPERAIVETSAHAVSLSFGGSLGPLLQGSLSAGFRSQTSPQAEGESRSFRGLVVAVSLQRSLGHASSLGLQLGRATQLSAFETNAYYVNNSASLQLAAPLPFAINANGTLSFLRNDYPNPASGLGVPRRDDVLGWSLGLGRSLGWRAWIRADYRRERRDSNLPAFDVTTDGYVIQLGLGLPRAGGR